MFRQLLLFPFSLLYAAVVWLRNRAFDRGLLKSSGFDVPCIVVGNLNAGGTGKTPHTEYLLRKLSGHKAVISRGYGRLSKGFQWVEPDSDVDQCGDEPLQIKRKFPEVPFAVCEDRVMAVPKLVAEYPETEFILFDDAYQHRYLKADFHILLTAYNDLFTRDRYLPLGRLREQKSEARRADAIIVTKCPDGPVPNREAIIREIQTYSHAPVYFSRFRPLAPVHAFKGNTVDSDEFAGWKNRDVLLLSGIAHGVSWAHPHMKAFRSRAGELIYRDHYRFRKQDIVRILQEWNTLKQPIILTTEKDVMRLLEFEQELKELPLYYVPIEVELTDAEDRLLDQVASVLTAT